MSFIRRDGIGKNTVDESILRWCVTSLASVHRHQSDHDARTTLQEQTLTAERSVEAAAFIKLAESRGFAGGAKSLEVESKSKEIGELLRALVDSCPLSANDLPETLGSLHEFIVSRRTELSAASARRSSQSRKIGGVFYTPPPVIDYIVRQTIGRRLERATPDQVRGLTIVDPAAGCGFFLLAAFRVLVDWHLQWYVAHEPDRRPEDVVLTEHGWKLTGERCQSLVDNHLYGVDLDAAAIVVARRTLWLTLLDSSAGLVPSRAIDTDAERRIPHLRQGHSLIGLAFGDAPVVGEELPSSNGLNWGELFPQIAARGGFDIVLGNPPYRRERNFKCELDDIAATSLGRFRSPRMDLWYYFVHRGIQLLREGGTLSFIANAYWISGVGADKLIAALRDDVHLDELFLLLDQPVFPGVLGQHLIFRLTKSVSDEATTIKVVPSEPATSVQPFLTGAVAIRTFTKTRSQLFRRKGLDVWPETGGFFGKLNGFPRLVDLGLVRQGIAENPAAINRRTLVRFREESSARGWKLGEGVFALRSEEVDRLALEPEESKLLRPYHDLCDLGRYWIASQPSRQLIYSTRQTCPDIINYPGLHTHLARFRAILEARRETRSGSIRWWHLHWPRDVSLWNANKLVVVQMAARPHLVPTFQPTYVSFSANVFVPSPQTREDLRYLCGLLNSRVLWAWFIRHAKRRGIGLELNGHVLEQAPIRRIDFGNSDEVRRHDEMVALVDQIMRLERSRAESRSAVSDELIAEIAGIELLIDRAVSSLYGLEPVDVEQVDEIIHQ